MGEIIISDRHEIKVFLKIYDNVAFSQELCNK